MTDSIGEFTAPHPSPPTPAAHAPLELSSTKSRNQRCSAEIGGGGEISYRRTLSPRLRLRTSVSGAVHVPGVIQRQGAPLERAHTMAAGKVGVRTDAAFRRELAADSAPDRVREPI